MNLKEYFRDRLPCYLIYTASWALCLIFLYIFRMTQEAMIIVSIILLIGVICAELRELIRRKSYYDKLINCFEELDSKYLISEIAECPEFYDGAVFYDILQGADKAMCEKISEHRSETKDFREYIELWVHEIKLPVASLQLMSHNEGNSKYTEQLNRIDEYIENVLYYTRSGNAEKDYIIKNVPLKRVFADTAVKNRNELQQHNVSLSTEGLDVNVMTDSKWMQFILGQLMGNSMKYLSPDREPEIKVWAEQLDDKTVLHFRDNGIGIPKGDLPKIFEKSFTGENGHTHAKSTGMGLYIVKKLCNKLGHTVSADSVQGEYTEIIISFGKNELYSMTD